MKWEKKEIDITKIPDLISWGKALAKTGNPLAEQIRCIYRIKDRPVIYMIPLLDYIDQEPDENIVSFSVCQMVN